MNDFNTSELSLEARLRDYGTVLQAELNGTTDDGDESTGTLLIGGFAKGATTQPARHKPVAAIMSMAAAVLVLLGLIVPTLVADDPGEPITVTGGELASEQNRNDDRGTKDDDAPTKDEVLGDKGDNAPLAIGEDKSTTDEIDWSNFSIRVTEDDKSDADDVAVEADKIDAPDDATEKADQDLTGSSAATGADGKDNAEDPDKTDPDKADPDGEQPNSGDTGESALCPAGAEKRDGECVKIGAPPTGSLEGCPEGAVLFGSQCYEVVPPTCGDLEVAPDGEGCLKLVGSADGSSACPGAYELSGDGTTCTKNIPAGVTCTQGTPVDGSCLIKQETTGSAASCSAGQLHLGGSCYELTSPTLDCGELLPLPDGNCRYPVTGESATTCPVGFEGWQDFCYRYEDPPTYDCDSGQSDGAGWCKITEDGTPGLDVCDDGVLQDASGCYVLWDTEPDGTCNGLPEFEGKCREAKSSWPTWTCGDGTTVYESTCESWQEATSSCATGELVDSNTKCKTIVDAIATDGCPEYALEDGQGCYKSKEPVVGCGELAVAPDGEHCKQWISNASGSGGECPAGFDLVGNYCKKYVDGAPKCTGGVLSEAAGKAVCRFTTAAGESTTGCEAGQLEKAGNCYLVIAGSCVSLDADIYGNGCKKPIATQGDLKCQTGYTLVGTECIKKL